MAISASLALFIFREHTLDAPFAAMIDVCGEVIPQIHHSFRQSTAPQSIKAGFIVPYLLLRGA